MSHIDFKGMLSDEIERFLDILRYNLAGKPNRIMSTNREYYRQKSFKQHIQQAFIRKSKRRL